MKTEPIIENTAEIKLLGKKIEMSVAENKTKILWQSFMPRLNEIKNAVGSDLYSVEIYSANFFNNFNPTQQFEKWAAIRVADFSYVPAEFETLVIQEGLYAVFNYKGKGSEAAKFYGYIFTDWIPNSKYILDKRPHFAVMGKKYKNEDANSEEELWIPVKVKIK